MSLMNVVRGVIRKSFGKIKDMVPVPNLIEIQSRSFNDFVQLDYLPAERQQIGLEKVLRDIFPIDHEGKMSLEYVSYELGHWACICGKLTGIVNRYTWTCTSCKKGDCSRLDATHSCPSCKKKSARYKTCPNCLSRVSIRPAMTVEECRASGQSFSMPLKIRIQLITWDEEAAAKGKKVVRDIKEQDIFFADVPVMMDLYEENGRYRLGNQGTFLINGVDRVVVSQIHRSPGVFFSQSKKTKDVRGRPFYLARIIPMRGAWVDMEFDSSDNIYVRIDKKKKVLATTLLQALGIPRSSLIPMFYPADVIVVESGEPCRPVNQSILGVRIEKGMLPGKLEDQYVGMRITKDILEKLKAAKVKELILTPGHVINKVAAADVMNPETGEIIIEQGQQIY